MLFQHQNRIYGRVFREESGDDGDKGGTGDDGDKGPTVEELLLSADQVYIQCQGSKMCKKG